MSDDLPPARVVRLVLDTTAVTAFVRGSIAVGELLAEVDAEYGAAVIPLPCLVEAAAQLVDGREWLDILLGHPATVLVADEPDQWPMLAGVRAIVGAHEPAAAAWLALDYDVDVLTRVPERYAELGGGSITLPFTD